MLYSASTMHPPFELSSLSKSVLGSTPEAAAFWALLWKHDEPCSESLGKGFSPLFALDDKEVLEAWPNPDRQGSISREQGKIAALYAGLKGYRPVPGNGKKLNDRIWKVVSYFEVSDKGSGRRSSAKSKPEVTQERILAVLIRIEAKIGRIEQQLGLERAVA